MCLGWAFGRGQDPLAIPFSFSPLLVVVVVLLLGIDMVYIYMNLLRTRLASDYLHSLSYMYVKMSIQMLPARCLLQSSPPNARHRPLPKSVGDQTPPLEQQSQHNPTNNTLHSQTPPITRQHADQVRLPPTYLQRDTKADHPRTESAPSPAKRSSWTSSPTTRYVASEASEHTADPFFSVHILMRFCYSGPAHKGARRREGRHPASTAAPDLRRQADVSINPDVLLLFSFSSMAEGGFATESSCTLSTAEQPRPLGGCARTLANTPT